MNSAGLSREAIEARVKELGPWFHRMNLRGVDTAPDHFLGDYPNFKFKKLASAIPEDLTGKTVLDIGCNAGFYAMEMKRRGAARVVGTDSDPRYLAQARFAAEVNGLDIEFRQLSVYDVASLGEKFDLVIFMGVLYHLRHPLLALDLIHEYVAGDLMLFQTMQRGSTQIDELRQDYDFFDSAHLDSPGYPKMVFFEHRYAHDPTNWWAPNSACTEAMLRSSGFELVQHPEEEVYLCRRVELSYVPEGTYAVHPATAPAVKNGHTEKKNGQALKTGGAR